MCGIAGVIDLTSARGQVRAAANSMANALSHRGPDAQGVWVDDHTGVAFGHARLAIRDLSPSGGQPMTSSNGRFVIVYNGEIYSHIELKKALNSAGVSMRGSSDTEAIIECVATFGLDWTLERLIGMFAFGLWDKSSKVLTLVRDRMGIKPLYWSHDSKGLIFGSELKALHAVSAGKRTVSRDTVAEYLRFGYVPTGRTILENVFQVEPATLVQFHVAESIEKVHTAKYWNLRGIAKQGIEDRKDRWKAATIEETEELLKDSVRRCLVADVPVGSLLSGGIDSSLVTAMMTECSTQPVHTYTIGMGAGGIDEAPHARAIASFLGTTHTELYVDANDALPLVQLLPAIYDEPFGDSSQLPSILVSRLTRSHTKVVMTGDGGDELFAGYSRYPVGVAIHAALGTVATPARVALAKVAARLPMSVMQLATTIAPRSLRRPQAAVKLNALFRYVAGSDPNAFYRPFVTHWIESDVLVLGTTKGVGPLDDQSLVAEFPQALDRMQLLDMLTYLPGDILVKMDRASMSAGLEARVPMLDHRLVELSWRLPIELKLQGNLGKLILRQILGRRIPASLTNRPKQGFAIPIHEWLRGPLREWAGDLLSVSRLEQQGLLESAVVSEAWRRHQEGEDWSYPLWDVLMLQAWIDHWRNEIDV